MPHNHYCNGTCILCARERIIAIDETIKTLQRERNGLLYDLGERPFND